MNSPATCTLIISTYNWPAALDMVLKSVLTQTRMPDEVIIADDGSTDETVALIKEYQSSFPTKLIHLWQADEGFRLATARNKAIAAATAAYIIQIDGDVILHRYFVEDHVLFAQPNTLLQGSRVLLGPLKSARLLASKSTRITFFDPDIKRRENGIRWISLARYLATRYRNRYPVYFARGANMSFWKTDLLAVNGYNEAFEGWGHEDSDLTLRLMNNGKKKSVLKGCAIVYHLYHKEDRSKSHDDRNKRLLEQTLENKTVWTAKGLNQYL